VPSAPAPTPAATIDPDLHEYLTRARAAHVGAAQRVRAAAAEHADLTAAYRTALATSGLTAAQLSKHGFPPPAAYVWRPAHPVGPRPGAG